MSTAVTSFQALDLDYPENDLYFGYFDSIDDVITEVESELAALVLEKPGLLSF